MKLSRSILNIANYSYPNLHEVGFLSASLLYSLEFSDEAIRLYKAIPHNHYLSSLAVIQLASLLNLNNEEDEAIKALKDYLKVKNNFKVKMTLGDHYRYKSDWENAQKTYTQIIENEKYALDPNLWNTFYRRGIAHERNKQMDLAEKDFAGLVIGNQAANFSVGANIGMIFMMAAEQEYDELNMAIKYFQDSMMRMRYSSIPTISAPHGMALGGGCELSLHADKVVAAAETYMGLVEFGVGVIPGGGGSKEMALRAQDQFQKGDVQLNVLQEHFLTIGMAKVSTSAYEAFDLNLLQKGKDVVVVNKDRQIAVAKQHAKLMAESGYTQPTKRTDIKVLGKQALGMFLVGTDSMQESNYISEHDMKIANKLANVMAGGDLSEPTLVSEQYLLDLEREAFLSLCTERKTLERIQHMLKTGKPLRN